MAATVLAIPNPILIQRLEAILTHSNSEDLTSRVSLLLERLQTFEKDSEPCLTPQFHYEFLNSGIDQSSLEKLILEIKKLVILPSQRQNVSADPKSINLESDIIKTVPQEIWAVILSQIENPFYLKRVCKTWHKIVFTHQEISKRLFQQAFGTFPDSSKGSAELQFNRICSTVEKQFLGSPTRHPFNSQVSVNGILGVGQRQTSYIYKGVACLLSGNRLMTCESSGLINFTVWNVSQTPEILGNFSIPQNFTGIDAITLLDDVCYLLPDNQILNIPRNQGFQCVIHNLEQRCQIVLFKTLNQSSFASSLDVYMEEKRNLVAFSFFDGNCEIWDLNSFENLANFKMQDSITAICFDQNGKNVLLGYQDGSIQLVNIDNPQSPLERFKVFESAILQLSIQGNLVAAAASCDSPDVAEIQVFSLKAPKMRNPTLIEEFKSLSLQGTQLLIAHGNPLVLSRFELNEHNLDRG